MLLIFWILAFCSIENSRDGEVVGSSKLFVLTCSIRKTVSILTSILRKKWLVPRPLHYIYANNFKWDIFVDMCNCCKKWPIDSYFLLIGFFMLFYSKKIENMCEKSDRNRIRTKEKLEVHTISYRRIAVEWQHWDNSVAVIWNNQKRLKKDECIVILYKNLCICATRLCMKH